MTTQSRVFLVAIPVAVFLSIASTQSRAEPIQWLGNQHWYESLPGPVTWQEADSVAQSMSWMGFPGHLATLASAGEDQFVCANFGALQEGLWLGGFQDPPDDPDPLANWHWVTGEDWQYTNWWPGEPNDGGGGEFYLDYSIFGPGWNDESDRFWVSGFVVEYDGPAFGACCFPADDCLLGTEADCQGAGGIYMGDGTWCSPDACGPTPSESVTWGRIKSRFR